MLNKIRSFFKVGKSDSTVSHQKRLLIFALGRTGSTLFEDLLQSTGYFKAHGELFHPSQPIHENPLHHFIEKANQCENNHFISHIKVYEMESVVRSGISKRDFIIGLIENGWQIVYLTRTNKLRHNLSSLRSQETSVFHTESILPFTSFTVDCFKFKHSTNQLIKWNEEEREILKDLPILEIQYEKHLENSFSHQSTINTILDHLKLPHRKVFTKHKKVIRGELKSLIENYEEFSKVMKQNGFGEYLD
jgi:LPS sulfotransferase NodH